MRLRRDIMRNVETECVEREVLHFPAVMHSWITLFHRKM